MGKAVVTTKARGRREAAILNLMEDPAVMEQEEVEETTVLERKLSTSQAVKTLRRGQPLEGRVMRSKGSRKGRLHPDCNVSNVGATIR